MQTDETKFAVLDSFNFNQGSAFIKYRERPCFLNENRGCPRGVMVKAMDCGIVVSEFVL